MSLALCMSLAVQFAIALFLNFGVDVYLCMFFKSCSDFTLLGEYC